MDEVMRYLAFPEADIMRAKLAGQAKEGKIPLTDCPHHVSWGEQAVDVVGERDRYGRPLNLFQCTACHQWLRLVDFHGKEAADG